MQQISLRIKSLVVLSLCILINQSIFASDPISSSQAINFVGSMKTVCGQVVSAKFLSTNLKGPTFLNLDQPYPDQIFTALIWGTDRQKFAFQPELEFYGKKICVSGVISLYKNKAEIIVTDPSQISVEK